MISIKESLSLAVARVAENLSKRVSLVSLRSLAEQIIRVTTVADTLFNDGSDRSDGNDTSYHMETRLSGDSFL